MVSNVLEILVYEMKLYFGMFWSFSANFGDFGSIWSYLMSKWPIYGPKSSIFWPKLTKNFGKFLIKFIQFH